MYSKELKAGTQMDIQYSSVFIATLFTVPIRWKQPKCPLMDEWINKTWSIHTMEYYSALRRNEILIHATRWMNLKGIMLSEISKHKKTNIV